MNVRFVLPFLLLLAVAGSAAGQSLTPSDREIFLFRGLCEPSAALPLGSGRFVVGDDDKKDLRVYGKERFGEPAKIEISKIRGLEELDDLEGAAKIGDTFYWITSHSRNKAGNPKPGRRLFFAVKIDPATLAAAPVGKPYTKLLDDLQSDANLAPYRIEQAAALAAEAPGALNIEGLAATPDGKLLLGFRSPTREGKALVVTLNNPEQVTEGAPASFDAPIELDLGGLGIRSLEFWPTRDAYVIIAGPSGASGPFQAFFWPRAVGALPKRMEIDLTGLVPEALFIDPDAPNEWFILSDDGDFCPKAAESKAFRAARIPFFQG